MQIRINRIEFEVEPVAGPLRAAVLADPVIARAVLRDVWEWDAAAQTGKALVPLVQERAVVLPNGLSFFVPRSGADGAITKHEAPSASMAKRMLKVTGARDLPEVMTALNRVIDLPKKTLPLATFRGLDARASYRLRMFTEFAVLRLNNAARNLGAFLFLPSQVGFHAEIGETLDPAQREAVLAEARGLRPGFLVPARSEASRGMRRAALSRQFEELQAEIAALGGADKATDLHRIRAQRLAAEWKALTPPAPGAPGVSAAPGLRAAAPGGG